MKRYILSGSILLALSMACEEKKKIVRRPAEPQVPLTEVTSSPEINLPSLNASPSETKTIETTKEPIVVSKAAEPEKMALAAKTVPPPTVHYEDVTSRVLAEGSANERKNLGLERIREKAQARAREWEAEAEAKAEAAAQAEAQAGSEHEAESLAAGEMTPGAKVAMVEPSTPASEVMDDNSPAAELPMEESVKVNQNLDRKTSKALDVRFHKAMALVKAHRMEEAKNEFLSICQAGHAHACHKFAWYEEQAGNKANASRFYRAACDNGLGKACNNLAFQYEQKKNYEEALSFYSRGCLEKHAASCNSLKRVQDEQKIEGLKTR